MSVTGTENYSIISVFHFHNFIVYPLFPPEQNKFLEDSDQFIFYIVFESPHQAFSTVLYL